MSFFSFLFPYRTDSARTQNTFEKNQTYRVWFEGGRWESPRAWPNEFLHSGEVWLAGGRGLCYDFS